MSSLLAQLYTKIKVPQEDIATISLCYILNESVNARHAVKAIISKEINFNFEVEEYIAQTTGENLERPDISGYDLERNEVLIIEGKFWASLTSNQPDQYISRLKKENSVLLFICPDLRKPGLIYEIQNKLKTNNTEYSIYNESIKINNKWIIISTWAEVNNSIRQYLVEHNDKEISDIDQLIGFCNLIDQESFLPILDDDLSPSIPRRIISYCDIIDKISDRIKAMTGISNSNTKSAGQKYGYVRYYKYNKLSISIEVNYMLWAKNGLTPFYLSFGELGVNGNFIKSDIVSNFAKEVNRKYGKNYLNDNFLVKFLIPPLKESNEESVVLNMIEQLASLINLFKIEYTKYENRNN